MKRNSSNKRLTSKKVSYFRNMDPVLLLATVGLLLFGLYMIYSASNIAAKREYGLPPYHFFLKHIKLAVAGIVASIIVIKLNPKTYGFLSKVYLLGVFILLAMTEIHGIATNGSTSWINIGPIQIQPSEFAKSALILYFGCILGSKTKWKDILSPLLWVIIPAGAIFLLVAGQPDLGSAMIIGIITMIVVYFIPFDSPKWFKIAKWVIALCIAGGIILMPTILESENFISGMLTAEQRERVLEYKDPCNKYQDSGYQVCHGYIAINSGGLTGQGIGNSTQKFLYLPEAYTDFIFPIITEELGVVTAGIILLVYLILLIRILMIAANATDLRGSIIALGTFAFILAHIVVNLGGVLALMPLTGVPLPFLSYGGSFLINLLVMLAFTQRVAIDTRIAKQKQIGKR